MERRTPLTRRAGLTARTVLMRGGGLARTAGIRRESVKRAELNRVRRKVIAALRRAQLDQFGHLFCERCGRRGPVHGHELRSRAQGGSITDPANIRLLCDLCNTQVEDDPIPAAADGWKISRKHPRKDPS